MKIIVMKSAAFIAVHLIAAYIAWMCGFNFDNRSPIVGYWAFVTTCIGIWAAIAVGNKDFWRF